MEPRSLDYIARACHGRLLQGPPGTLVHRVSTDSRSLQPHDLFVALSGPKFDGHAFLQEAALRQAAAVLVDSRPLPIENIPCGVVQVDNPRSSLGILARQYRSEFSLPIVAVAGSNGKTSTKNLIASVLSPSFPTLASEASFNNDIGVPLTLLRLESHHQAAVLEVGTNHPGELEPLLRLIQPSLGVLTNLGPEHLEFFGDLDGVIQEEGWLAELLPSDGHLFTGASGPALQTIRQRAGAPVTPVGLGPGEGWRADRITVSLQGTSFAVTGPCPEYAGTYHIPLLGRHQACNALLALAVGAHLGVSPEAARRGLASCPQARMRLHPVNLGGILLLDDSYNANLDSVRAALETCQALSCPGRRVAVLGDLAELGDATEEALAEIGREAARRGLDLLVTVGEWSHVTAQAARAAGLVEVHSFPTADAAARHLKEWLRPGDLVLLKASRAAGLERIADLLRA